MATGIFVDYDIAVIPGRNIHKEFKDKMVSDYGYSKTWDGQKDNGIPLPNTTLLTTNRNKTTEDVVNDVIKCAKALGATLEHVLAIEATSWRGF